MQCTVAAKKGAGGLDYDALTTEMVGYLASVARKNVARPRGHGHVVQAAKAILEHVRSLEDPLTALVETLGDDARALAWMRAKIVLLEARVAARALPPKGNDHNE